MAHQGEASRPENSSGSSRRVCNREGLELLAIAGKSRSAHRHLFLAWIMASIIAPFAGALLRLWAVR